MSIIQQIRDRAAWLVFGLIAVSLIGFLLMDASVGRSRLGQGSGAVGSVNGEKLDYVSFSKDVQEREEQYKSQGYPVNDMMEQNIRDEVWKKFQEDAVLDKVYDQAGIDVSDKEVNDMLVGMDPIADIRKAFTDPKTGYFDGQQAAARINQLRVIYNGKKKADPNYESARRFFEEGIPQIIRSRQKEKYLSLLTKSVYIPKWMVDKANADKDQISSISLVNVPYATIPDSSIRVSDEEVETYLDSHKDQYEQQESRGISYVSFNAAANAADSNALLQQVGNLKAEFATTTDIEGFMARNGTETGYQENFVPKSKITGPRKDSLANAAPGTVIGPYLDGPNYVLARVMEIKTLPDSVRARHILVATVDQRTGQPTMEDSTGKNRIDSIRDLIDHGARFDSLAINLSDDEGSKVKGGDLGYFTQGQMVKEFNDFTFSGKKGDKKIVKTQFGYHYIEITDQKAFEPAYKIAYFSKRIEPSPETDANASGMASQFAGESRKPETFDANSKKGSLRKQTAMDILPADYSIQGLGTRRDLVRWIFDAKLGDVSESFPVGDKYVVAMVTEINHKGTMTVAKSRPIIEPILRNQKKAEVITKKISSSISLETVASLTGQSVSRADSISFSSPYLPNVGAEPRVVGYSFNRELKGKPVSAPVAGNGGVFVIRVENTSARANLEGGAEQTRQSLVQMQESLAERGAVESLKKTAEIKDNRGKF
jgi:peptidyl-prolyl cis-trans isomerase D